MITCLIICYTFFVRYRARASKHTSLVLAEDYTKK